VGPSPENCGGQRHQNFGALSVRQLGNWIANIPGTEQDIGKRKTATALQTAIYPAHA